MENTFNYLIENYNRLAYTHNYVFGFIENHIYYGAVVLECADLLYDICSMDIASSKNGGTKQLKYKPNKAKIALIKERAVAILPICSVEDMERMNAESRQNRGQIFEKLVADNMGGVQSESKTAKFTDCGDIVVKGVHYQVKNLKATFTDERTIGHMLAA